MLQQKLSIIMVIFTITCSKILVSQNNTSSPYSLFGLGIDNKNSTGNLSALGNTGIANDDMFQVNITNPASLGNIQTKSFLYEFGASGQLSTLKNNTTSESTYNGNVSHFAIAFPIKHNWGIGLGILPQTKVGYDITVTSDLEGSTTESFFSNISGEGGLNKFYLATGIKFNRVFSVGIDATFLFGDISQTTQTFSNALFTINENNHYTGMNVKTGFQYSLTSKNNRKTSIGGILEIPVSLSGSQTVSSFRTTEAGNVTTFENETENDLDNDFAFPIISGIGITSDVYKDVTASLDFKRLLWEEVSQGDNEDLYKNQSIYAFGVEYAPSEKKLKYLNRLKYRFGFNYNSGFLNISDTKINSYFLSLGAGIPLDKSARNFMNISYSYGKEGNTNRNLVQENYHKISLNLSFIGNWFKERKIF